MNTNANTRMSAPQLKAALNQFSGTEQWYQHTLCSEYTYTDGVRFLAREAGAYWLLDLIFFLQYEQPKLKGEGFQCWSIRILKDGTTSLVCHDGNYNRLFRESLGITSFPLKECTLYLTGNVLLLPSEY